MLNKGLSLARIAEERGLVESTMQGHLRFFVVQGTLSINRLLSPEKVKIILFTIQDVTPKF